MQTRHVELQVEGVCVFSSDEYMLTAKHAQRTYDLNDDKLMDMYRDYKDNYECQKRGNGPSI